MKTLGLIGGTSWLSTVDYYRIINQTVNEKRGGLSSAKLFLYSLNMAELKKLTDEKNWNGISSMFCSAAKKLEQAGGECIVICANMPHKFAEDIRQAVQIPLIHIAEVTAKEIRNRKIRKAGLLGTKITMEDGFFKDKLWEQQVESLIPDDAKEREFIHASIFNDLGKGIFTQEAKTRYIGIIKKLVERGAEGIIFGCTEIPLLIKQEDCPVPVFDTASIHAKAAAEFALKD